MAKKKTAKGATKKIEKKEVEKVEEKVEKEVTNSSNKLNIVILAIAVLVILAIAYFVLSSQGPGPEDTGPSDAEVLANAIEQSRDAMSGVESTYDLTIGRGDGVISRNESNYLASFPITGSADYLAFDVLMDDSLIVTHVGLNGRMEELKQFTFQFVELNDYQTCAKVYNEKAIIPELIARWYKGEATQRFIMQISPMLECNGVEYPYDLEIGNGYVKTTLKVDGDEYYFTNGITEGIVTGIMLAPSEDISRGVFIYVDRVGPNLLTFTYGLKDKSIVAFDAYDEQLVSDYSIQVVPSLVWNCKFVNAGTKATGELNGTFLPGSEDIALRTLACIFNNGFPTDICESIGIVRNEDGIITASIPTEYYLTMYQTGLESCKPDEDTVSVEAFYPLDGCTDCDNQRRVLNSIAEDFGEYMNLTYYCAGDSDGCQKFVDAR